MKNAELSNKLRDHFSDKQEFTTIEATDALQRYLPGVTDKTIAWKLSQLKKEKFLFQKGRGLYSFNFKPEFSPELSLKSKRQYNRIKGFYPGEIVICDTNILKEISGSEIPRQWIFIALRKEDLDALFAELRSFSKPVYIQPDKETFNRYILHHEEAVILTALITETPIVQAGEYHFPSIEGILVNAWLEYEQFLQPFGIEILSFYKNAFSKYNVNKSKLLRYAARRDKRKEINELLKSIE